MPRRAINPRNHNLEPLVKASAERKYKREQLEAQARIEIERQMREIEDTYYAEMRAAEGNMVALAEIGRATAQSYGIVKQHLAEAHSRWAALQEQPVIAPTTPSPASKPASAASGIFRITNGWTVPVDPSAITTEQGPDVEIKLIGMHLPPGAKEGSEVSGSAKVQVRNNVGNPAFERMPEDVQRRAVLRPQGESPLNSRLGTSVIHTGTLSAELWAWLTGGA